VGEIIGDGASGFFEHAHFGMALSAFILRNSMG